MALYTVKTLSGLEEVCAQEIAEMGYPDTEIKTRAVNVTAPEQFLYDANYRLATAIAVLKPIQSGSIKNARNLYDQLVQLPWDQYMDHRQTFLFKGNVHSEFFNNSIYAFQLAKDALVDFFRSKFGRRPSVDKDHADIHFVLRVYEEKYEISLDSSGPPLFQRGYRQKTGKAPLNEVLAAGILRLMKWDGSRPLVDPMCGSGTFIIEAARMVKKLPAQYHRKVFSFHQWPDYDAQLWEKVKAAANTNIQEHPPAHLLGADRDGTMIEIAKANAGSAGVLPITQWKQVAFQQMTIEWDHPVLIMNPPYDVRLQQRDVIKFYGEIGSVLKHRLAPCEAWIFTAHTEALQAIGLRPSQKIALYNGPLPAQLRQFTIFAGKRKDQYD